MFLQEGVIHQQYQYHTYHSHRNLVWYLCWTENKWNTKCQVCSIALLITGWLIGDSHTLPSLHCENNRGAMITISAGCWSNHNQEYLSTFRKHMNPMNVPWVFPTRRTNGLQGFISSGLAVTKRSNYVRIACSAIAVKTSSTNVLGEN